MRPRDPITTLARHASYFLLLVATAFIGKAAFAHSPHETRLPLSSPRAIWTPCTEVKVYLDERDGFLQKDLLTSIRYLRRTTGIQLRFMGTTRTPQMRSWLSNGPGAIVVSASSPTPRDRPDLLGLTTRSVSSQNRIIAAFVVVRPERMTKFEASFQTMLHELAHAVGLDHSGQSGDLMYPHLLSSTVSELSAEEIEVLKNAYSCDS